MAKKSFALLWALGCALTLLAQTRTSLAPRTNLAPANTRPATPVQRSEARTPNTTKPANQPRTSGTRVQPTAKAPAVKPPEPVKINWMTYEEAVEKCKTEKRKIFIDVYTEWCGWCKKMDSTTFTDPSIAKYLNEKYYAVKFDAEQKKDIVYKDKTYKFVNNGQRGYHELAAFWLNNRLGYPSFVFLDEDHNLIQALGGYQEVAKLDVILHYFGTDNHKKTPWEKYEKNYVREK
jgi:thioredoxin-related protein